MTFKVSRYHSRSGFCQLLGYVGACTYQEAAWRAAEANPKVPRHHLRVKAV